MDYQEYIKYEWVLARRAYAALCDYLVYFIICAIYFFIFSEPLENGVRMLPSGFFPFFLISWLIWFPGIECIKGQTVFKKAFKLRVIFEGMNNKDRIASAFLRHLVDPLDLFFFFGIVGILTAKFSKSHKRLGDFLGGTHVVWERNPRFEHAGQQDTADVTQTNFS